MSKGFTLIELLMVVVIVGVLVLVAMPKYQIAVERGRALEGVSSVCWLTQYLTIQQEIGNTPSVTVTDGIVLNMDNVKSNYFRYSISGTAVTAQRQDGWNYKIVGSGGSATCQGDECAKLGLEGTLCEMSE